MKLLTITPIQFDYTNRGLHGRTLKFVLGEFMTYNIGPKSLLGFTYINNSKYLYKTLSIDVLFMQIHLTIK